MKVAGVILGVFILVILGFYIFTPSCDVKEKRLEKENLDQILLKLKERQVVMKVKVIESQNEKCMIEITFCDRDGKVATDAKILSLPDPYPYFEFLVFRGKKNYQGESLPYRIYSRNLPPDKGHQILSYSLKDDIPVTLMSGNNLSPKKPVLRNYYNRLMKAREENNPGLLPEGFEIIQWQAVHSPGGKALEAGFVYEISRSSSGSLEIMKKVD